MKKDKKIQEYPYNGIKFVLKIQEDGSPREEEFEDRDNFIEKYFSYLNKNVTVEPFVVDATKESLTKISGDNNIEYERKDASGNPKYSVKINEDGYSRFYAGNDTFLKGKKLDEIKKENDGFTYRIYSYEENGSQKINEIPLDDCHSFREAVEATRNTEKIGKLKLMPIHESETMIAEMTGAYPRVKNKSDDSEGLAEEFDTFSNEIGEIYKDITKKLRDSAANNLDNNTNPYNATDLKSQIEELRNIRNRMLDTDPRKKANLRCYVIGLVYEKYKDKFIELNGLDGRLKKEMFAEEQKWTDGKIQTAEEIHLKNSQGMDVTMLKSASMGSRQLMGINKEKKIVFEDGIPGTEKEDEQTISAKLKKEKKGKKSKEGERRLVVKPVKQSPYVFRKNDLPESGKVTIEDHLTRDFFNHSNFPYDEKNPERLVDAAGEVYFKDGKINDVGHSSGHYRPPEKAEDKILVSLAVQCHVHELNEIITESFKERLGKTKIRQLNATIGRKLAKLDNEKASTANRQI